jgi:hypothetical protein
MKGWVMSVVQKNGFGFIAKLEEILFSFTKGSFLKQSFLSNASKALVFTSIFVLAGCGGAEAPNIDVQPRSKLVTANTESTLQVSASVSDGGVLVYQWYCNTQNSTEGGVAIEGENSDVLTFTAPSEGFAYYYAVVANVNTIDNSTVYGNATSDVAVITAVDYPVYEVSFYDNDLKLLGVETVKGGETINVESDTWYPVDSEVALEEGDYEVGASFDLFSIPKVIGINNRAELEAIKNDLNGKYVLNANIDLSGKEWEPIGDQQNPFNGIFLGKFHKISGLYINKPTTDYVGLFGHIKGGHVLLLRLSTDGIVGRDYVGGIAGYVNYGTITAVTVYGDVKGDNYVGGIAGAVKVGTITATFSIGKVKGAGDYVGGVAGDVRLGTITATSTIGNVEGEKYVGGVAGYTALSTVTATFGNGNVNGEKYVGGVVGYLNTSTLVASFLHGTAKGSGLFAFLHSGGVTGRSFLSFPVAAFIDRLGFLTFTN